MRALFAIALLAGCFRAVAARADDSASPFSSLLAEKAPALVTIKFVLKVKMAGGGFFGGDRESDTELTGLMIDPAGLVLCSSSSMSGNPAMMRRLGGTATPSDIKVLIGDDTEGVPAELIARDTELDLAWVRIKQPRSEPYAHVDLSQGVAATLGQPVYSVNRLGKFFDRAPLISEGRIGGGARKPRRLYLPVNLAGDLGLPVFTASGQVIGVFVMQRPDPEESDGGTFGGGGARAILPAEDVLKATRRALEVAAADAAEGAGGTSQPQTP
jgi:S1-C subfamily serine protease